MHGQTNTSHKSLSIVVSNPSVVVCLTPGQMWMSVSCFIRRCVKAVCVSTTFPATPVTVPADSTTTRICWSASVSSQNALDTDSLQDARSVDSDVVTLCLCVSADNDECQSEDTCTGGLCVNTLGTFYCTCESPLVLDDTQRNCVNASGLTEGKRCKNTLQHQLY